MLLDGPCCEALDGAGVPMVGQVSALGCFMQLGTSASAGVSAARDSEAVTARPMAVFLSIGILLA
jgi:hypothetical protein